METLNRKAIMSSTSMQFVLDLSLTWSLKIKSGYLMLSVAPGLIYSFKIDLSNNNL